ncbi:hypothetical protein QTO34_017091 [Cnephaeus nilssonii]|uniref:Uncharacterized protein n=1 Tax=Cnephaeus nilssonii TaxID=3371016 RepID=A0AA40I183_CNENI|nr:hypothetical protein QTO34_017091 [Eptesicus nilssonii]
MSGSSSITTLKKVLQQLQLEGFGGAQMRPSCEAMQAAVGPWAFFWVFWVSLTQLPFVRGPVHDLIMHLVHQRAGFPPVHQAFRKPPARRRLSKALVLEQTAGQLPRFGF